MIGAVPQATEKNWQGAFPLAGLRDGLLKGPIGVFDSGIGGLTVVRAMLAAFRGSGPGLVYGADRAFAPYGQRTAPEILQRSLAWIRFFAARWSCGVVVSACHTSSAILHQAAQAGTIAGLVSEAWGVRYQGMYVLTMVQAVVQGVRVLQRDERPLVVIVMATALSTKVGVVAQALQAQAVVSCVEMMACPHLAPALDAGQPDQALRWCRTYRAQVLDRLNALVAKTRCPQPRLSRTMPSQKVVVLGCTHYPLMQDWVGCWRESAPDVQVLDPAIPLAQALVKVLDQRFALGFAYNQVPLWRSVAEDFSGTCPGVRPDLPRASGLQWVGVTGDSQAGPQLYAQLIHGPFAPLVASLGAAGVESLPVDLRLASP